MTKLEAIKKRAEILNPKNKARWPLDRWDRPKEVAQLYSDVMLLLKVGEAVFFDLDDMFEALAKLYAPEEE